jgi:hypothetical protein
LPLPWTSFEELEGAPDHNLELLCRGLVQRAYGRYGQLRSRRNQPGVEFYLKVEADCDLGETGRCFGWQCRWFALPKDHSLGVRRREKIEDAIKKAKSDVDDLTDFVLCLKELPRKKDLDWYFGLDFGLKLHLWAEEELDARLTGDAAILRRTYFGELVVTAEQLAETHARSIEPIAKRWVPALNVVSPVERTIRLALARTEAADALTEEVSRLRDIAARLESAQDASIEPSLKTTADNVTAAVVLLADRLAAIADACSLRRPAEARELLALDSTPVVPVAEVRMLARALRRLRLPEALAASTVEADIRQALALIRRQHELLSQTIIAVVGAAGNGKTQLAGELTAPLDDYPAGILIRGSDLRTGGTLDELATRLPGLEVATFDDLLETLDAGGARLGARIPILIDGLNEAERPSEWRTQLAQVAPVLNRYEHVLLIVTLRSSVRESVLPEDRFELTLEWDEAEVEQVVARYFEHYKIDPGATRLPIGLFHIPLFVRLFCESVNPDADHTVGVENIPSSLVAVFELYLKETARRLRDRPGHPSLPDRYVERKLAAFAAELWNADSRDLSFEQTKVLLDDAGTSWDDSLVRALEEEGLLFREGGRGTEDDRSGILFDLFAGYLIAEAITGDLSMSSLDEALSNTRVWAKLGGGEGEEHPLANDVLVNLVGLLPRRFSGRQLWPLAPEQHRPRALIQTIELESNLLDDETIDRLRHLIRAWPGPSWRRRHPFDRLWEVRDAGGHRLNAQFLDAVLRDMSIADRDERWTEWTRARLTTLRGDLALIEEHWTTHVARGESDDLNALAIAWLTTSTSLPLRDEATRALQRYGRADPARLFDLAGGLLEVNDPYVTERVLGAAFGVAATHQMPDPGGQFEAGLREWLELLKERYLEPGARTPISHQMARQYIAGCFELAAVLHPAALPPGIDALALPFATGQVPDPMSPDDPAAEECQKTFGMDFENYIIGPLYEGRGNYQTEHEGYQAGLADVRGRVWELGWREAALGDIDTRIRDDQWRRHENPTRTERYGKKYGWIAYYELAGRLADRGQIRDREWTAGRTIYPDIDPSFPEAPTRLEQSLPPWAGAGPDDDQVWFREGLVDVPDDFLVADPMREQGGPWVLVEGFLEHRDAERQRRVWGFIRGILVSVDDAESLQSVLTARPYLGNFFIPPAPEDHMTFAGEIPWSVRFHAAGNLENGKSPYVAEVSESWDEPGIEIELLGHGYDIEASRTVTNQATGHWVPSYNLAAHFGLRQRSGTLDLVSLDGGAASATLDAPDGFSGKLLYIRRDLLGKYAGGRKLLQLAWGERQVDVDWANPPGWLAGARNEHEELWRHVQLIDP